jgi:hypothetical protein
VVEQFLVDVEGVFDGDVQLWGWGWVGKDGEGVEGGRWGKSMRNKVEGNSLTRNHTQEVRLQSTSECSGMMWSAAEYYTELCVERSGVALPRSPIPPHT